jgi:hypothetical protein
MLAPINPRGPNGAPTKGEPLEDSRIILISRSTQAPRDGELSSEIVRCSERNARDLPIARFGNPKDGGEGAIASRHDDQGVRGNCAHLASEIVKGDGVR